MREEKLLELNKLILELLDGAISEERFAELDRLITEDPEAAEYYAEFIAVNSALCKPGAVGTYVVAPNRILEGDIDHDLWGALAESERRGEAIEMEDSEESDDEPELVIKRHVASSSRQVSRFSLFTAVVSTAALLMLLVYIWLVPERLPIVATITETADAKWADTSLPSAVDSELRIGPRNLISGFARITFNKGAEVLAQGPCEFVLEGEDQFFLQRGRIYSTVPTAAIGFVVRTPGATVVDYGTEFGVVVDSLGQTEAHVFNGKVELRSGPDPIRFSAIAKLTAGMAGMIDDAGRLSTLEMKAEPERFVKSLLPVKIIGKAGGRLDLADVVGGGDGFGGGVQGKILDPVTGCLIDYADLRQRGWYLSNNREEGLRGRWIMVDGPQTGANDYIEVSALSYIDGIFVPDGGSGQVEVSSAGHFFSDCPDTNNQFWAGITNYDKVVDGKGFMNLHPMQLGRRNFATGSQSGLFLHANIGVTFDLETIRLSLPGTVIRSFRSRCGIGDITPAIAKADFWVLVDGQVRFSSKGMQPGDTPENIHVELQEQDRFLTIVTTDGDGDNSNDWCIFASPSLRLEARSR